MRITAKAALLSLVAAVSLGGCASTDRYGYGYDRYGYDRRDGRDPYNRDQLGRTAAGAAVGAGVGAAIGAVIPGVNVGEGAAVGALGGAIVGATSRDRDGYERDGYVRGQRWSRDQEGYCYWVDGYGRRTYDYNIRC